MVLIEVYQILTTLTCANFYCSFPYATIKRLLNDISHKILKKLMFRMSLLNLINFIIKKNVNLSSLIKCFNEYFIFNVDLNMFLIFIKTCLLKYYKKIQDTFFYVLIFNLINKLSCQFEFLLRMLISNNICYVNVPSCDVLLGS